jgi:adenine-specific DNA-methyltransferase
MLSAQKEVHLTTSDSTKNVLHQKISILDKQIDKLVYELFSLTEKEIQIVEDGAI